MNDIWYVDVQTDNSSVAFENVWCIKWMNGRRKCGWKNPNGNETCHFMANLILGATRFYHVGC